jgi:hypothetical protein
LDGLARVPDLARYVCPAALDLFSYVVNYVSGAVDSALIDAFAALMDDPIAFAKAVKLLAKIAMANLENEGFVAAIGRAFAFHITSHTGDPSGAIMLRILLRCAPVPDDVTAAFLASSVPTNIVAGYESLFLNSEKTNPNLVKVDRLVGHLVSDDHDLRRMALEFVREFASNVDGDVLLNIVKALVNHAIHNSSDKAVLLLCRVAADPRRAAVLLRPDTTGWIGASENAARLMRLFAALFGQPPLRTAMLTNENSPEFLATVLAAPTPETFFAVCWVIRMADPATDQGFSAQVVNAMKAFLQKVSRTSIPAALASWLVAARDPRPIRFATAAMATMAEFSYLAEFNRVVLPMLRLVEEGSPAAGNCLALLHAMSQWEQANPAFREPAALGILRNCRGTEETGSWIQEICRRLGLQRGSFFG